MHRLVPALVVFLCAGIASAQVTYSKEVARIFQAKCQQCHRDGDVAPMALNGYETAVEWSRDILNVLNNGTMPPWKPVPGYGDFRDSRALTDDEKQTLMDWLSGDMPEGDPADLPAPTVSDSEWTLGQPDLVLQMAQGYTPPIGQDIYRCFVIPTTAAQDTDMSAIDFIPGNRAIVHHIIVYQDTTGQAQALDGVDGQPGYTCFGGPGVDLSFGTDVLAGWAPGQRPSFLPDGIGIQVKKGAAFIMQVHYSPSRSTGEDVTRIGLYRATAKVQKHLYQVPIVNDTFKIPAGASDYAVKADFSIPFLFDATAINIYPHMHLLGRQIKVDMTPAGKDTQPMIYEDNWDFRWQGYYTYNSGVPLKAGTKVSLTCTFDNSDNNPNNPNNPLVEVRWGERTKDEMCIALVGVTFVNEALIAPFLSKKPFPRVSTTIIEPVVKPGPGTHR
jgi:copper type II ascorbate-dependent monooxygenase-like protein/cbb3-type cytochrome c oxidase subunit III